MTASMPPVPSYQPAATREPRASSRVVAIAASAGGLRAIEAVLSQLPTDFPAAVVIVQHLYPKQNSILADVLARHSNLPVRQVRVGSRLEDSVALVAPPDRHVVVHADGSVSLSDAAAVHYVRPSADVLFASVAASFGARAVAVVLTGSGRDGTAGVQAVKAAGGAVIAQDEATSEFFGMPGGAIAGGVVDYVLPLDRIAARLCELVGARPAAEGVR